MSDIRPLSAPASAAQELRATAWRLIAVLSLALIAGLAARLALGPSLF